MMNSKNLKGRDALNRVKNLMGENTTSNSVGEIASEFKLNKVASDNHVYSIVKENSHYFIKKALMSEALSKNDFQYIGGLQNKNKFKFGNFSESVRILKTLLVNINNERNINESIDVLVNDCDVYKNTTPKTKSIIKEDIDVLVIEEDIDEIVENIISDISPIDDLANKNISEMDNILNDIDTITEKYVLKVPTPKPDFSDLEDEEVDSDFSDMDMSDDDSEEPSSEDNPFGEPFDAGVEANEEEDPEKFLQQLSGKLATSLRGYNSENDTDVDLQKFVANTVLSAVDTDGMDDSDINDIVNKLKDNYEDSDSDSDQDIANDEFEDIDDEVSNDDDSMGEDQLNETEQLDSDILTKIYIDWILNGHNDQYLQNAHEWYTNQTSETNFGVEEFLEQYGLSEKVSYEDMMGYAENAINHFGYYNFGNDEIEDSEEIYENTDKSKKNSIIESSFQKNIDEYLKTKFNDDDIYQDEEQPKENGEETQNNDTMTNNQEAPVQTPTKPEVKPQTEPDRKSAPFKKPGEKPIPQPKFRNNL